MIVFLKNKKIIISFFILVVVFFSIAFAQAAILNDSTSINAQNVAIRDAAGFDTANTIGDTVGYVIKAFIMLLGIIFVVLLVLEGYKWMMARGEEEKVREARDGIMRAVIGIIIVISAYAITYFVFTNLPK